MGEKYELCITNEELCIKNEKFCIKNEGFASKMMNFAGALLLEPLNDANAIAEYKGAANCTINGRFSV